MLFARLVIILGLTKGHAVKHIAFQMCRELFPVFFSPI
jgi:hypothetical protein